jgi:hypothetical protein
VLSIVEDIIAFAGVVLAVFAPVVLLVLLAVFLILFFRFLPRILRRAMRMGKAVSAYFSGKGFDRAAR